MITKSVWKWSRFRYRIDSSIPLEKSITRYIIFEPFSICWHYCDRIEFSIDFCTLFFFFNWKKKTHTHNYKNYYNYYTRRRCVLLNRKNSGLIILCNDASVMFKALYLPVSYLPTTSVVQIYCTSSMRFSRVLLFFFHLNTLFVLVADREHERQKKKKLNSCNEDVEKWIFMHTKSVNIMRCPRYYSLTEGCAFLLFSPVRTRECSKHAKWYRAFVHK